MTEEFAARNETARMIGYANQDVRITLAEHADLSTTGDIALVATPDGQVKVMVGHFSATLPASYLKAALDQYTPGWDDAHDEE